jgi:hypothetical protein
MIDMYNEERRKGRYPHVSLIRVERGAIDDREGQQQLRATIRI